jgi:signal transduction histidine kinase/ligand-binding sensor domain-containing protein
MRRREVQALLLYLLTPIVLLLAAGVRANALDAAKPLSSYGRQSWRTENGLPQNTVHAILQTHDGFIWLATEGGLVRFDGVKFTTFDPQNTPALRSNNIRGVAEDSERNLWIATADGLSRYHGTEFRTFTVTDGLPSSDVLGVIKDPNGRVRVTTREGDCEYERGHFRRVASPWSRAVDKSILCRYVSRNGSVWLGTESGLARVANGKREMFPANDPLASETILSLLEDREGNLWVGTDADGVTLLRDQNFGSYGSRDGLPSEIVHCTFEDRHGALWVGTDAGLALFDGARFVVTTPEGASSRVILSIAEDAQGNLLLGTPDGLNTITDKGAIVTTSADGLPDDFIRSLYADADGSLWIGTRRGLSHWSHGQFVTYTERDGLGSDLVGVILRDRKGKLWVGTYRGLSYLQGDHFLTYSDREGLSGRIVTALHDDGDGALWIGTQDGGLTRFKDGVFHRYAAARIPGVIYGMAEDAYDSLWLAGKSGVYRVSRNELNAQAQGQASELAVASYGTLDGLSVSECSESGHPGVIATRDGALWFAMRKGVATTRPRRSDIANSDLPVVIESISADDRVLGPMEASAIGPGISRLAFEYAGLSYSAPHSVRFKYKLEGFDDNWINAGTRRVAYYTNIPPGRYRFRVLARANDGEWGESGAAYRFRVRPRFYQTYWFGALVVLLFALLVWQTYHWRVRHVQAQYDAVLAERNRIAREIHDTLAQGFVAVSLQLELISQTLDSSKDAARALLAQAQTSVQQGLTEARRSIWELRSHGKDQEDLASKLAKVAADINAREGVRARFQVFGTRRPLPADMEHELLKIGQEAVANALRHAEAQHVKIDLSFAPKKLVLAVTDDGRGFVPETNGMGPDGHYGLRGMRERAQQIHARLNVESSPGRGTEVLVEAEIA